MKDFFTKLATIVIIPNLCYAAILYTLVFIALKREGRVASFKEYAQDMPFTSWIWKIKLRMK